MPPDWRPPRTVRDPKARRDFHRAGGGQCAVCGTARGLSLHHVYDRDDVPAGFVFLCGDGVRGCHGLITNEDREARAKLGAFIAAHRPDTIVYVLKKAGREQGVDWFRRRLFVDVEPVLATIQDRRL